MTVNKTFDKFTIKRALKNVTPIEEEDSENVLVMTKMLSKINLEETLVDVEETEKASSGDLNPCR